MATLIEQWEKDSLALVAAAAEYASKGVWSEEADSNIRRVRMMVPILAAAAQQAAVVAKPPPTPPTMPGATGPTGG